MSLIGRLCFVVVEIFDRGNGEFDRFGMSWNHKNENFFWFLEVQTKSVCHNAVSLWRITCKPFYIFILIKCFTDW